MRILGDIGLISAFLGMISRKYDCRANILNSPLQEVYVHQICRDSDGTRCR